MTASVYAWSGFYMGTGEDPSLIFLTNMHVKDQVLWNVFGETFSDSFRQNLSPYPHCQIFCCELPTRSRIFCLLYEVVYWPCHLKYVYPTINLAFGGIIVDVKLPICSVFNDFVSKLVMQIFFLLCLRHWNRGLTLALV